jgi:glyceraldehyde 3-phosphate dehydrogenase
MVINDRQLKMYLWYDNEWGYANRTAELMKLIAYSLKTSSEDNNKVKPVATELNEL